MTETPIGEAKAAAAEAPATEPKAVPLWKRLLGKA
jgi:hypothetical protein